MAKALDTLQREHRDMEKLLGALERQLEAFDGGLVVDYDIVQAVIDYSFAYPDLCHHPVEDLIYEKIEQRAPGALNNYVDLPSEHKRLAQLTRTFSDLVKGVVQETSVSRALFDKAARDYIDFTRRHMEMEEKFFFPVAEAVLTESDWSEIDNRLAGTEDPLFSGQVQQRFRRLRDDILPWDNSEEPAA